MKRTVAMPVSQAREGRKTSALENYLIRFFERELEVKLSRREMWRSVRFGPFRRFVVYLVAHPGHRRAIAGLAGARTGSLRLSGSGRYYGPVFGERR